MEKNKFDLEGFRNQLQQLEKDLVVGVSQDENYQGEIDDVIDSIKRLEKELKDDKYQDVLSDLFKVLNFLDIMEEYLEEESDDDLKETES